ncbi:FOG: PPR repeat [Moesziomyces antarcticus T-34]|uniref:FOG: PPR repeat n=1 Tax=Pseudozyma antarctica (strain T-34) TaxID=1151754 RepID=M9LZC9_PSEA3|nr:FOG: PPR repeat [Moesziomyces antarcticus T-34]
MVDRIPPRASSAAAGLVTLLRLHSTSAARPSSSRHFASVTSQASFQGTSTAPSARASSASIYGRSEIAFGNARSFASSSSAGVSAHRKQAGREKARQRAMRQEERVLRQREKEGYNAARSIPRRPRDPIEEDVEASIREYMARTGPRGERLTLAQQERLLKQELKGLGHDLERLEKKEAADKATQDLPELDDQTLDELYQALMLPPPPTPEEARLARLEGGRRERGLLDRIEDGRGRKSLDRLAGLALPPSTVEVKRERTARDLKQKLIHARERAKILLPPSKSTSQEASAVPLQAEAAREEVGEETSDVDFAALPFEERQEVRLQQLFARLALVQDGADAAGDASGSESLSAIKSGLAGRIARILKQHEYELHPSTQSARRHDDDLKQDSEVAEQADTHSPEFESVRLDRRAPSLATGEAEAEPSEAIATLGEKSDVVARADAMIKDLGSAESRAFMLDGIERLVRSAKSATSSELASSGSQASHLPLGVATTEEWMAIAVSSARAEDDASLQRTLSLMEAARHPASLELYNNVLDVYASKGRVAECQEWLQRMTEAGLAPDDHTYHSLTKAYVTSAQFLPALELLNSLEQSGHPAAMATYTLVIDRLLDPVAIPRSGSVGVSREERPELQALAWNVFYHMRLHAHPVPDAPLYALMIRACARGIAQPHEIDDPTKAYTALSSDASGRRHAPRISDAERALDLFREMTTRYNVRPNAEVYNSLILACARRKDFYLDTFRLLREMVELETERAHAADAEPSGMLRFAPDTYTFNALLQGCARNRDLARARWVLAEMIRTTMPLFDPEVRGALSRQDVVELLAKRPNHETMCHIFHTYASYEPPLKRDHMQITRKTDSSTPEAQSAETQATPSPVESNKEPAAQTASTEVEPSSEEPTAEEAASIFSALVPQTASDLVSEARSLFARILADQAQPSGDGKGLMEGPLGGVEPGVRVVNAYLTVLAAHLPVGVRARVLQSVFAAVPEHNEPTLEHGLFARLGVEPNEHSFRIVLEALSELPPDPATGADIVQDIWSRFERLFPQSDRVSSELVKLPAAKGEGVDWTQVRKAWSAYIHFWAKNVSLASGDSKEAQPGLDYAMVLLRRYASLYPPRVQGKKKRRRPLQPPPGTKVDLSPLPVPVKSLHSLHFLANPTPLEEQPATPNPGLGFLDVQLLHHRLVRYSRTRDLAYLAWILHRYAASR